VSYGSIRGDIQTDWKLKDGKLELKATIPVNTTATVYMPAADAASVLESGRTADKADGVKFLRMENGAAVFDVGSGSYFFASTKVAKKTGE
jgi:hypothetical protein